MRLAQRFLSLYGFGGKNRNLLWGFVLDISWAWFKTLSSLTSYSLQRLALSLDLDKYSLTVPASLTFFLGFPQRTGMSCPYILLCTHTHAPAGAGERGVNWPWPVVGLDHGTQDGCVPSFLSPGRQSWEAIKKVPVFPLGGQPKDASLYYFSSFPLSTICPSLLLLGITVQINYLHTSLRLRLYFQGNPG